MTSGIYIIENKKTGQIYIGQSKNIEQRFKRHCSAPPIDVDIAINGEDNFTFDILEEVEENLIEREKFWIKGYGAYENDYHYNLTPGGTMHKKLDRRNKSKYTLWDSYICYFHKQLMYSYNKNLNPRKCFLVSYQSYKLPIGGFYDFTSCEIISELINSFIYN